jgi:uncharacterized protein YbjT (DUF2867 family)
VARCLIVGCGCRGRLLAVRLQANRHVVRGTTRRPDQLIALQIAGVDGVVADPDRLVTLIPALEHVGVICILLGSAQGSTDALAALHGPRLEALLVRILDTTVRGVIYEAAGTVEHELLSAGAATVAEVCGKSRVPFALIEREPAGDYPAWATAAADAVTAVIG